MSELYALLLWLLCVGISAIAIGYYIKYYGLSLPKMNEGFVVITCPANSTKYINKHGDTNCCNGDIVNDECNGNNLCSLSLNNSLGIPNCSDYVNDLANDAATENCFADMPYYFAASDGRLKGCSAAITVADGTAPSDPGKLQCILYPTAALDEVKLDSCFNYKKNKAALSGANCPVTTGGTSGTSAATSGATSATANPTGYVMSGDGITGQIPVQYIVNSPNMMAYFAQNGPNYIVYIVKLSVPDPETYGFYNPGDLNNGLINMDTDKIAGKGKYTVSKIGEPSSRSKVPNTGYSMSGDTITGKIPVLFIVNSGINYTRYFAQNGSKTIFTNLDITNSNTSNGFAMTTDITQPIITYNSSVQNSIVEVKSITISKTPSDAAASMANGASSVAQGVSSAARAASSPMDSLFGSRTATPTAPTAPARPQPPSSTNPNDYILTGGNPSVSNLQVGKIISTEYNFYFFAQNGNNVNYVVLTSGKPKFVYQYAGLFTGNLSEFTDEDSFKLLAQNRAGPGSDYTIKKKDGTETYGP